MPKTFLKTAHTHIKSFLKTYIKCETTSTGMHLQRELLANETGGREEGFKKLITTHNFLKLEKIVKTNYQKAFFEEVKNLIAYHQTELQTLRNYQKEQAENSSLMPQAKGTQFDFLSTHNIQTLFGEHKYYLSLLEKFDENLVFEQNKEILNEILGSYYHTQDIYLGYYKDYLNENNFDDVLGSNFSFQYQNDLKTPFIIINSDFEFNNEHFNPLKKAFELIDNQNKKNQNAQIQLLHLETKFVEIKYTEQLIAFRCGNVPTAIIHAYFTDNAWCFEIIQKGLDNYNSTFDHQNNHIPLIFEQKTDFLLETLHKNLKNLFENNPQELENDIAIIVATQIQLLLDNYFVKHTPNYKSVADMWINEKMENTQDSEEKTQWEKMNYELEIMN